MNLIKRGEQFRYYKGDDYVVLDIVILTGSLAELHGEMSLVLYKRIGQEGSFVRELSEFFDVVEYQGSRVPKFTRLKCSGEQLCPR